MYKLIRRISSSFFPRPDRPWSEDATSTAPQIGRKRRYSSTEPDDEPRDPAPPKKHRTESVESNDDSTTRDQTVAQVAESDVKDVTKGVREVELDDTKVVTSDIPKDAAAFPLPESPELEAQKDSSEVKDVSEESPSDQSLAEEKSTEEVEVEVAKDTATESGPLDDGVMEEKKGEDVVATVSKECPAEVSSTSRLDAAATDGTISTAADVPAQSDNAKEAVEEAPCIAQS